MMIPLLILLMLPTQTAPIKPFDVSLYTYSALNIIDCYSSLRAFEYGAIELNPILKPFSHNPYTFIVAKTTMSILSYYVIRKIYKKNKTMGWIFSIAGNALIAYVVYNNLKVGR